MSNESFTPGTSGGDADPGVSEERLRRPMGGFSPSSPDYRPLPPPNLPQPAASLDQATAPSASVPPASGRLGAPSSSRRPLDPPTLPDGVPTPGRIPAYPGAVGYRAAAPVAPAYAPSRAAASRPIPGPVPAAAAPSRPLPAPVPASRPLTPQLAPQPYAPYGPTPAPRPDMSPVAIEAICAVCGIYGVGWIMTGRTATGILLLLAGLLWDVIALGVASTGIGIVCTLPLHAVFITLSSATLSNRVKGWR